MTLRIIYLCYVILLLQIKYFQMTNLAAASHNKMNWNDTKEKIRAKFFLLTDEDLFYFNGKKDEMLAKIQIKLGKTKEELFDIIEAL